MWPDGGVWGVGRAVIGQPVQCARRARYLLALHDAASMLAEKLLTAALQMRSTVATVQWVAIEMHVVEHLLLLVAYKQVLHTDAASCSRFCSRFCTRFPIPQQRAIAQSSLHISGAAARACADQNTHHHKPSRSCSRPGTPQQPSLAPQPRVNSIHAAPILPCIPLLPDPQSLSVSVLNALQDGDAASNAACQDPGDPERPHVV